MNIIIIPNGPTLSGRQYCIAKELQAQGHNVTYFMWQHPLGLPKKELLRHVFTSLIPQISHQSGFTIHKAIRLPLFWPIINGWIFKAQLRRLYRKLNADIIFTESYTNETEVPNDLPFIYDLADDYAGPSKVYGSRFYKFAFKLLGVQSVMSRQCKNALAVTAVSTMLHEYAKRLNDNTILVPNGVERDLIEYALAKKQPVNPHSLVYATGLGPWSRAIETLETVTKLRKEFPDISLTLVGAGTEVPKIKRYIKEHNAQDYITYIEYVYDRQELFVLQSQHAIGLNISDKNAWRDASHPMKVMDYSALGMKGVSTNLIEVEKLGYDNLFIFSDADKRRGFKAVLRKALKTDPQTYKETSDYVLTNYSWTTLVSTISDIATQALKTKMMSKQKSEPRIIHVTYAYPPAIGGLEQVAQQLASSQAAASLPVSVITSNKGWDKMMEYTDTLPVTRLKSFVFASTTIIPGLLWQLLKLDRNDIVHLHVAQAFSPEIVWLASKIKGFRYVAHIHIDAPPSTWIGFLLHIYKPIILGRVLRSAHGVAVFTDEQKKILGKRYHLDLSRVHIIPNGVADEFFINKRRSMHKKPRLLFVGRLSYQKNLTQLLDALDGISDQFTTTLVGDGELRADLEAHAKKLNLKNITFAGFASGATLRTYYEQADIFVLPSEREGMPLVLLEAMAAGLPIVATRVTGNKDVVKHLKNGLLVPFGNSAALRAALVKLSNDKSLYRNMSHAATRMAQTFTWTAVRERFAAIYPSKVVMPVATQPTIRGLSVKLPLAIIPLLVLALASYAIPNIIGSAITLLFFLTVPGHLTLRHITKNFSGWWERIGLSVVLSLLIIMVGGLLLNSLHTFGLERPLTTTNIFIMLSLSTLLLVWLNRKEKLTISLPALKYPSKTYLAVTILLSILPMLAVGGAIRLNNGASNILTLIMFGLAGLLMLLLVVRRDLKPLYPYALYTIALGVLLSTSLRGWSFTGHDIVHEYQVFSTVAIDGFWKSITQHNDPYSACLSITILPTVLLNISHVTDMYIFKIVFQFIFSFIAVLIFAITATITNKRRISILTALIFILFPPFFNDMPFLNRQEIALLFFAAALFAALNTKDNATKSNVILVSLFLLGIVLSHYSTSYVTLGLLGLTWVVYKILSKRTSQARSRPLFSAPLLLGFVFVTFLWNTVITQTSPGLAQTISKATDTIMKGEFSQANGVQYSLLSFGTHDPQKTLEDFVNNPEKEVRHYPDKNIPRTPIGEAISQILPIETINKALRSTSAKLLQVFLLLGVIIIFIKYKKKGNVYDAHILSFSVAGFILLAMMALLPVLSEKYSVTRMFQQVLIFGGIPIVIAGTTLFKIAKFKYPVLGTAVIFIFMFLHLSGFLPQLTGGYPPQMALNNAGVYYDTYYRHAEEVKSATWLETHPGDIRVATDEYGLMRFPNFPFQNTYAYAPTSVNGPTSYLYQNQATRRTGAYADFINGDVLQYRFNDETNKRSLLYVNQGSAIYSPVLNRLE